MFELSMYEVYAWALPCGLISLIIAAIKGGSKMSWLIVGLLLGPLGILLAVVLANPKCPHCKSRIHRSATVCPKCLRDLTATSS